MRNPGDDIQALDALLLPINKGVIKKFKLDKGAHGVLVLSVSRRRCDKQGIKPGERLAEVQGHKVHKPIDVDVAVRRQLKRHSDMSLRRRAWRRGGRHTDGVTLESLQRGNRSQRRSPAESDTRKARHSY